MNKLPKISIVIPLYNVEEFIYECLQSVANQSYQGEMECVIVDDCGADRSVIIVEQFISNYHGTICFKVVHHAHNRGLSAARNTGVQISTGEYVYFLDSDDWISSNCIEVLVNRLKEQQYDLVIGDYDTFGCREEPSLLFESKRELIGNTLIYHEHAQKQLCVIACNKIIKRQLLIDSAIDFLEGQLHEDDLWTYKIMSVVQSIAIEKHVTYHYRMRETSIMGSQRNLAKKATSLYATVEYILLHQDGHCREDFEAIANTYIGKFIGYALESKIDFHQQYRFIRKSFAFNPLHLWIQGNMSLLDVKHRFHFVLPTNMGYFYLMLRRKKLYRK